MTEENKSLPQLLLEVHIDEDKQIESIDLIKNLVSGKSGQDLEYNQECYDNYALEGVGLLKMIEPDTLYHIYIRIDWYQSGYYEREWDSELTILNCIPVIPNYRKFLADEEDFKEQQKLREKDSEIEEIEYEGMKDGLSSGIQPSITYNEWESMAKIIAQHDIRLAHRLYSGSNYAKSELKKLLGNSFLEKIADIEKRRLRFKNYIRNNNHHVTRFTKEGYQVKYFDKIIEITFETINNLPDEMLLECESNFKLFEKMLNEGLAPFVMQELLKYN